jgi:hypothetical protein
VRQGINFAAPHRASFLQGPQQQPHHGEIIDAQSLANRLAATAKPTLHDMNSMKYTTTKSSTLIQNRARQVRQHKSIGRIKWNLRGFSRTGRPVQRHRVSSISTEKISGV